ncbi:MAG TPA: ring-cleaving dioxygenase [Gemmatimonadaceae bacterium]|jgi:glyoxalase family protein|nr:ring-cleaving dioxygenase [Gemmatimonadaceae bacterium]
MPLVTPGIHHVTAIASDPQKNLDFYAGVLGLRLVKRTVNFDDPTTYHFYFGDAEGNPGSIFTVFPWPDARRGRQGAGQIAVASFAILPSSVGFWIERFIKYHVEFSQPVSRFDDERVIAFKDPDGLMLELVAHASAEARPKWTGPSVPADHSIRGIYSVTLWQESCDLTGKLLTETLGFRAVREQASIFRYAAAPDDLASIVDLRCVPGLWEGVMGAGTIHHVAFRAPDDESQSTAREELVALGYNVTPQIDRDYFHSVYFREPGGVLFEIATDPPGFTVDEPLASLGQSLKLPEWLEPRRFEIEALLPNIRLPMRIPGPNA